MLQSLSSIAVNWAAAAFAGIRRARVQAALAFAIGLVALSHPASAEPGVSEDKITFGQVAALDGPASALGQEMRTGLLAAFAEANAKGGVKGRKLELISRDDGYEPTNSIAAIKQLIDENQIFGLVGAVGTPTSQAIVPIAAEAGLPFIGPFTAPNSCGIPASETSKTYAPRIFKKRK